MPFTAPKTWIDTERVDYTEMNTYLRDNLLALKNPPTFHYETVGHSVDYTTTSTTFTPVDSTNLALTITTTGDGAGGNGGVMIGFTGTLYSTVSNRIYFRILRDGVTINIDGDGLLVSEETGLRPVGFMFLDASVAAGSHTYTLEWKTNTGTATLLANAGTVGRDCKMQFWVREMS